MQTKKKELIEQKRKALEEKRKEILKELDKFYNRIDILDQAELASLINRHTRNMCWLTIINEFPGLVEVKQEGGDDNLLASRLYYERQPLKE